MADQNIFGYIPTDSMDWSKALGGLYTTVRGIETGREDLKLELDQIETDNIKTVQQADNFTSQTFQQMMLGASQDAVSVIKSWNDALKRGELDPKQYKQNMNNLMGNWGTLANNVKSFDSKNADIQKQIQDGTLSELSVDAAEYFARSADLKNLKVFVDPSNGGVNTGRLDAATGQVIPDTIESSKTTGDLSNAVFPKIDLTAEVKKVVDSFGVVVQEDNITTVTDATRNPRFAAKLADLTGSLTNNDRYAASILRSSIGDGYKSYYTEQDRQSLLMQAVERQNQILDYQGESRLAGEELNAFLQEAEGKLIPMKKDSSGVYQPMITDEQRARAKKAVEDTVFSQIDFKSLQDEPRAASGGGSSSNTVKVEDKPEYYKTALDVRSAWVDGDVNALSSLSGGKYLFEKKGENTYLIINASNPKDVKGPFYKLDDVGGFFGVGNRDTWTKKMGKARSAANNQQTQQPKMTQDQWNNKWATLKKGQTMVGLDGVTYTKK